AGENLGLGASVNSVEINVITRTRFDGIQPHGQERVVERCCDRAEIGDAKGKNYARIQAVGIRRRRAAIRIKATSSYRGIRHVADSGTYTFLVPPHGIGGFGDNGRSECELSLSEYPAQAHNKRR